MKKHIPNALTSCNLICGGVGIIQAFNGDLKMAVSLIWLAGLFDFLDGFSARMLKVSSDIGKQLDSLADMVTFGVLPSIVMFLLISDYTNNEFLPYLALSIAVFSAVRLAKFNIDDRQTSGFIGLPTPATALFVSSLPFVLEQSFVSTFGNSLDVVLIIISVILSILMVVELPLLALKFKDFSWKNNAMRYLFLIVSLLLIVIFQVTSIPLIIFTYILVSVFNDGKIETAKKKV